MPTSLETNTQINALSVKILDALNEVCFDPMHPRLDCLSASGEIRSFAEKLITGQLEDDKSCTNLDKIRINLDKARNNLDERLLDYFTCAKNSPDGSIKNLLGAIITKSYKYISVETQFNISHETLSKLSDLGYVIHAKSEGEYIFK